MAGGSFIRAEIKCPFYCYDDVKRKKIACEGVTDDSTVSQVWKSKKSYTKHTEKICCANYKSCAVYKMLMAEKYSE